MTIDKTSKKMAKMKGRFDKLNDRSCSPLSLSKGVQAKFLSKGNLKEPKSRFDELNDRSRSLSLSKGVHQRLHFDKLNDRMLPELVEGSVSKITFFLFLGL
jgi:hypothetical protein